MKQKLLVLIYGAIFFTQNFASASSLPDVSEQIALVPNQMHRNLDQMRNSENMTPYIPENIDQTALKPSFKQEPSALHQANTLKHHRFFAICVTAEANFKSTLIFNLSSYVICS